MQAPVVDASVAKHDKGGARALSEYHVKTDCLSHFAVDRVYAALMWLDLRVLAYIWLS